MRRLVNKKNIYLLALFVICLLGAIIVPTYAKFSSNYTTTDDVVGLSLDFNLYISNIEEYEEIVIPAGDTQIFYVQLTNNTGDVTYYGIWYKMIIPDKLEDGITIGQLNTSTTATTNGSLENDASTSVPIVINNDTTNAIKIAIGVGSSSTSISDIEYLDGKKLITGSANACTLTSTTNYKASSQTVTVSNLDESNVSKYYWGTSSNGTPESITQPTLTANAAGIWYLRFEDTSGNISGCEITMRSYTVNNMLSKTNETFDINNYDQASTYTYIIPNNTLLPLESIYTIPTGASADTFKGVSTGVATTIPMTTSMSAVTLNSNTTYSMWFNRLTYTVSYDANNGSGAPSSQTKIYGVDLTLSSVVPTRANYKFLGWATSASATSATYSANDTYSDDTSVTLYAVWE